MKLSFQSCTHVSSGRNLQIMSYDYGTKSFERYMSQNSLDPFFQTQKDLINIFHTRLSSLVSRRLLNVPPPSITSYIVYWFLFLPLQIDIYMKQFLGSLYKPPAIPCMYLILVCTLDYIYILHYLHRLLKNGKHVQK